MLGFHVSARVHTRCDASHRMWFAQKSHPIPLLITCDSVWWELNPSFCIGSNRTTSAQKRCRHDLTNALCFAACFWGVAELNMNTVWMVCGAMQCGTSCDSCALFASHQCEPQSLTVHYFTFLWIDSKVYSLEILKVTAFYISGWQH